MLICAGNIELIKNATPIGIGLIQSAIGLTQIILKQSPQFLTFLGSAGAYTGSGLEIFELIESQQAVQIELSALEGKSYSPLALDQTDPSHTVIVNSSNYITTDPTHTKPLVEQNILLENMEFYSVVQVAKHFNLPVKGIFAITNYTNAHAHKDFIAHHAQALRLLEAFAR